MSNLDPATVARQILATNRYLTMATADSDGRPWATPVWFASDGLDSFCWVSRPGARHSVNISARPAVAIVVFDSTVRSSDAAAVYLEAQAAEVEPADRTTVLGSYNKLAVELGLPAWTVEQISGAAQFRLYRATVSQAYVLDEHDQRIPVSVEVRASAGHESPGAPAD